jgi:co-chaperonin GroES (HSP10)
MKTTVLHPLEDRVLIDPDPAPTELGGLKITDTHKKAHQLPKGTVVAVGPGLTVTGSGILFKIYKLLCKVFKQEWDLRKPMPLDVGDRVMYGAYANMEVEDPVSKDKFLCLRLADVFMKIDEESNKESL